MKNRFTVFVLWHKRLSASAARGSDVCKRTTSNHTYRRRWHRMCTFSPSRSVLLAHHHSSQRDTSPPSAFTFFYSQRVRRCAHQTCSLREMHDITILGPACVWLLAFIFPLKWCGLGRGSRRGAVGVEIVEMLVVERWRKKGVSRGVSESSEVRAARQAGKRQPSIS